MDYVFVLTGGQAVESTIVTHAGSERPRPRDADVRLGPLVQEPEALEPVTEAQRLLVLVGLLVGPLHGRFKFLNTQIRER